MSSVITSKSSPKFARVLKAFKTTAPHAVMIFFDFPVTISPVGSSKATVGKFEAGTTFNIIADQATLVGTVRYLDAEIQAIVKEEIERVVKGICIANNADYELNYAVGYPPLVNHPHETETVFEASELVPEIDEAVKVAPQMGGEDYAHYLNLKPGAFFFTGAQKEGNHYPHHHPMFDIDERAMLIAAKTLIGAYLKYQEK